jgi:thioesterase domain-containing protein
VELARLGEELGADQPLYGIQPQGLDGRSPIHTSIEDMAALYIAEMKSIQPVGPYRVGGHCSGSWVAFEMTRQLEELGDALDTVVLVDQGPPGVEHEMPSPWKYVAMRLRFYFRDKRLLHAIRWQLKIWAKRRVLRRVAPRTVGYEEAVRETHRAAYRDYEGGAVDHQLVLVRSDESLLLEDKEWHLEWTTKTAGGVRLAHTPGTHANLLKPGYVDDLAARLRWAFDVRDPEYSEN